jgi:hypothetical protein
LSIATHQQRCDQRDASDQLLRFHHSSSFLRLLQVSLRFRQLAIQLFNPSDEVENDCGAGKVHTEIAPQSLHSSNPDYRTSRYEWFISFCIDRLNQSLLDQPHDERPLRADYRRDHVTR